MITTLQQHILQQQQEISMTSSGQGRILDIRPEGIYPRTAFGGREREMETLLDGRPK